MGARPPLDLRGLLRPRSIAVVGASADVGGHAGRCVANLLCTGYAGRVLPVNPRYDELQGVTCYPSVADLPEKPDAAYVLVRADRVLDAVTQCAELGIGTITVCTSGFAELGEEGRQLQQQVAEAARSRRSRVVGPNCIGVLNVVDNVVACPTFNITDTYTPGAVTIVSQSGGMGVTLLNRAQGRGQGVRALLSLGNECDVGLAEVVDGLVEDTATRVIALFVEQVRDGAAFVAAAGRAADAGKPVVVLKVGRSEVGGRSVASHTGAMAGDAQVFDDVMRGLGVVTVRTVDQLLDTADLLARAPATEGGRLGVVSPSGGECGYVADRASRLGLELPDLAPTTVRGLAGLMRLAHPGNPLDLTGQVIGDRALLESALALVLADPSLDLVAFTIATWGAFDAERLLPAFLDAARRSTKPVVVSAWSAAGLTERAEQLLRASGVPAYPSSDAALDALAGFRDYWRLASRPRSRPGSITPVPRPGNLGEQVNEAPAKQLLAAYGIATTREHLVDGADDAVAAARALGWPVVVKQLCRGVVHKSDLGLVRLGVRDEPELRACLRELEATVVARDLKPVGVLVSETVAGLEMIVGGLQDSTFGPVVMVGAGGMLAEVLDDTVFLRCPVRPDEVAVAVDRLAVARALGGARGAAYDVAALCALVAQFSELLASAPWVAEADLNPVFVGRLPDGGAVAADAVLSLR